jgi:hypothetical protein
MDGRWGKDAERFMASKELKSLQAPSARGWKSPEVVRLRRIEEWRKERFERMLHRVENDDDRRKAYRAATLYMEVSARPDGRALGAVTTYRDAA